MTARNQCRACGERPAAKKRSVCLSCHGKARRGTDHVVGTVVRRSEWQVLKGDEVVTLRSERRSMKPSPVSIEEFLRPAQPVNVSVSFCHEPTPLRGQLAIFLPDPQVGFRRSEDGEMSSFHDDGAMDWAVQQVARYAPDFVIHLGDMLDLAPFSRFAREPGFAGTTQPSIDRAHRFLAEAKAVSPRAKHVYMLGNHDVRIEREVAKLIPELSSVRPPGSRHAALSVASLLRLDDLDVEAVEGYPANEYWVTPQLRVIHGDTVDSSGSTAAKILSRDRFACTVFGHCHSSEFHSAQVRVSPTETRVVWAASPGTLARIDGAVPSFHSGTSGGASVYRPERWVQGVGLAHWSGAETPRWEWVPRGAK